jgi:hypothetical protein
MADLLLGLAPGQLGAIASANPNGGLPLVQLD